MTLEATVICLDTTEYSRNGDFHPSRLQAQIQAGGMIANSKTQQHPESSVGLISTAGSHVDVLLTPSQDIGKILSAIASTSFGGAEDCDLAKTVQVAQLTLKHRQNKNQRQRIVVFVGSPVTSSDKQLEQLGKTLKKNGVSIDIIAIAGVPGNDEKLHRLVEAADSGSSSHYIEVVPGRHLSDQLLSSAVLLGQEQAATSGEAFEFGVDPSLDPELAMAIRLSMEEERRRGEGTQQEQPPQPLIQQVVHQDEEMDDELAAALRASLEDPKTDSLREEDIEMEDVDEEVKQALRESLQDWKKDGSNNEESANVFQDAAFIEELLRSMPGADRNDPRIQEALRIAANENKQEPKKDDRV